MAKKIAKLKISEASQDLRRWCIEQAIRWPWDAGHEFGQATYQHVGRAPSEPDVLQRAAKILEWVQKAP